MEFVQVSLGNTPTTAGSYEAPAATCEVSYGAVIVMMVGMMCY